MVFGRLLASVGIGGASIDTKIQNPVQQPGSWLRGVIQLRGGQVDQSIERIDLCLETLAEHDSDEASFKEAALIAQYSPVGSIIIKAQAIQEIPFEVQIPYDTPLNQVYGQNFHQPITLRTHAHIQGAVDTSDRDPLVISPNPVQERVLMALQKLGFRLFKADVEFGHIPGSRLPLFQELEFYPQGPYGHGIKELELSFVGRQHDMDVIFEMDKKSHGFMRLAYSSIDEVRGFNVPYQDYENFPFESRIIQLLGS